MCSKVDKVIRWKQSFKIARFKSMDISQIILGLLVIGIVKSHSRPRLGHNNVRYNFMLNEK